MKLTATAASFLRRSGLPARWRGRERFVVLDTDFCDGERFLACWQTWRNDVVTDRPLAAACQLHVIVVATQMPPADALRARWASVPALVAELLTDWPPAVPGLHRLVFDGGRVQLLLAVGGGARHWLPQLSARVDAYFIDGDTLAADTDAAWPLRLFKVAGRLAAPGATLVVPAPNDDARAALRTAGFVPSAGESVDSLPTADPAGATVFDALWCGRHAPSFTPRRAAHRRPMADAALPERHALIVGAGLAGCATAWALAELGWHSTLLDRCDAPAREASGNPGGLFHGVVHPQDGAHARFNRAAALEAARAVRTAIAQHGVEGSVGGLLRIQLGGWAGLAASSGHLPADYARIVDAAQASALAGIPIASPCWHFPGGGWVQPAGLARSFLERAGALVRFVGGVQVARLRRGDCSDGHDQAGKLAAEPDGATRWQLIDAHGRVVGESAVVVLAHAGDASALLAGSAACAAPTAPLQAVRGQLSLLPVADLARALPGLTLPRLPLVGAGWLLPAVDGLALFCATAQANDSDPSVRASDHAANIAALGRLTGLPFAGAPPSAWQGRTAWRCVAADRLPLIGAVPCATRRQPAHHDKHGHDATVRMSPDPIRRLPGLYTFSALGSRGITWAALGGQMLASLIARAPVPVSRGLIEAVDPGRFLLRQQRRGTSG